MSSKLVILPTIETIRLATNDKANVPFCIEPICLFRQYIEASITQYGTMLTTEWSNASQPWVASKKNYVSK